MMKRRFYLLSIFLILSSSLMADQLTLHDGSVIQGKLIHAEKGKVIFKTNFAGQLSIPSDKIAQVNTDKTMTVVTSEDKTIESNTLGSYQNKLVLEEPHKQPAGIVKLINPEPWQLGEGYKWDGKVDSALQLERGNTKTDEFDFGAESLWTGRDDRYTLRGNMEIDKANGVKNKDNWKVQGKYDRFLLNPKNYYGFQASLEQDEFSDLELRTIAGPYLGRQFINNDYLLLHGEVGVVFVDENYNIEDNNNFYGSNWELRLTSDFLGNGTQFYVSQDGILNFDSFEEVIINTRIGISFPLIMNIVAGAEVKYEYDGGAADDVKDLDETYNFRIGYTW